MFETLSEFAKQGDNKTEIRSQSIMHYGYATEQLHSN